MKRYSRSFFSVLLAIAVIAAMIPAACLSAAAAWGGGTAMPSMNDGYYLIDSGEKLAWFSNRVNSGNTTIKAKQTANLDMGNRPFTPIGTSTQKFKGIYNGGGYTISNLNVTGDAEGRGLFGYISTTVTTQTLYDDDGYAYTEKSYTPAEINNVTLTACSITGSKNVGGIAGVSEGGTVFGCSVAGTVTSTGSNVGGIVGYNYSGATIINCQNDAAVSGTVRIGGMTGYSYGNAMIYGCCNAGTVNGSSYVGGIVGTNAGSNVHHSYNKGAVTGTTNSTGGMVGYCTSGELYCMYTIGSVSCPGEYSGAVIGNLIYGTKVAKCYYDRSDTTASDSFATAAEHELMLDASFLTSLNFSMEIYVGDYFHTNNGYPILRWQLIGWDGSVGEPETNSSGVYLITSASELAWFAALVNGTLSGKAQNTSAKAQVMRDILLNPGIFDESSIVWTPIGTESSPFTGTFDGGEYRISGVYIPGTNDYTGLFGCIGSGGTVKNIFLESSRICGKNYAGAIAGSLLANGSITNCFNYSSVQSQYYAGGIAGASQGAIRTCGNAGDVQGEYYGGGITGANNGGSVTSCFNKGTITGVQRTGGIIGTNYGVINSCYNNGRVEGNVWVGGLVGSQNNGESNGFTACYNIGFVKGKVQVGAVVGYMQNGTLTYCYYDTERSGVADYSAGVAGKTTAQMAEPTSISAFTGFSSTDWVDRGADQYFNYCPELRVFYNSTNTLLKTTSKESAAVVKSVYTVMAEVDGEMNTYYASVKLGVAHIGTGEGTLVLVRDAAVTETTVVDGSVTITDNAQTRTLTRGSSFTTGFFTVNGMLTLAGTGTDTLCLNGGGTSMNGAAIVWITPTGRVTLQNGALITANNNASSNGGGVYVNGGELTMQGGKISDNTAKNGGGIYNAGGVLALEGGAVSGNTATNGGGLYLQGTGADVTLGGTAVSGNTATNGGGIYNQNSPVDWTGGTLSGNTAADQGGGAYNAGTLRLSGGSVSGNTAVSGVGVYQAGILEMSGSAYLASADDIYLPSGRTVTNTGSIGTSGTVANLTIQNYTAGTRVLNGEFCAANYAKFIPNIPSGSSELFINSTGYLVAKEMHNVARVSMFGAYSVYYTSLKEAVDAISAEAEKQAASDPNAETFSAMITMVDDDSIEETINVQGNIIVTAIGDNTASRTLTRYRTCTGAMFNIAEGATLEFGATGTANNASIIVDGGSALYGTYGTCIVENHGTLRVKDGATLQNASVSAGGAAIRNSGTLEITGGVIQNCTSAQGGAVWNEGTAEMTGGTIQNCTAQDGGAIYNTGTLELNGGTVTANTASQNGGGIYSASGAAEMNGGVLQTVVTQIVDGKEEPVLDANGDPVMIETVISGTLSANSAKNGGGLYVAGGTGSIASGAVTGNSAPNGGGIYLAGGSYTVKGGSISANTSTLHGTAIYNAAALTVESVQIDDGDVYLVAGHTVVPAGTAPSAVLTPSSYTIGTPMLSGSSVSALYGGFTVANSRFFINAAGLLDTTMISLKESSHMSIDYTDGVITGIDTEHRTVAEILGEFDNAASSLTMRDGHGTVMADSDSIYTGCVIVLQDGGGNTLDSKTFALVGDVNGDGAINGIDAAFVYYYVAGLLTKNSPGGAAAYRAADADNNGTIDEADGDLLRACGLYKGSVAQP